MIYLLLNTIKQYNIYNSTYIKKKENKRTELNINK